MVSSSCNKRWKSWTICWSLSSFLWSSSNPISSIPKMFCLQTESCIHRVNHEVSSNHLLVFELASRSTRRSISRIFSMHSWNSRLFSKSDPCFVKYERKKFWGKFDHFRRPRPSCCRLKATVKFIIEPLSESSEKKKLQKSQNGPKYYVFQINYLSVFYGFVFCQETFDSVSKSRPLTPHIFPSWKKMKR